LYEDINRDGAINADDRYLYKKPDADVLLGLSTQVIYKKFSIGATAHGMFGNYLYNQYNAGSGILSVLKNPINHMEMHLTAIWKQVSAIIQTTNFIRLLY